MSIVYITNASLNQISKSLRSKKTTTSRDMMIEDISSDFSIEDIVSEEVLNDLFNNSELKDMYFMKMLLKDFGNLLEVIQGNKAIVTEFVNNANKKYAYKVKAPSYHADTQCQWMNKSFHNIEIPQECFPNQEKKDEMIQWINQNKNLSFYALNAKFKIEFNCPVGLISIDRENSGSISFDNKEVSFEFNKEIKSKYTQLRFFLDGEFADKIKNMKYAPSFRIKEILEKEKETAAYEAILDFHTVKNILKQIIFDFYKKRYNSDLKFDSTLLDIIGFNRCRGCNS